MENEALLILYLMTWCAYVPGAHVWAHRKRLHHVAIIASYAVPSVVAITMTYVFLIKGGATVAQFAAGSRTSMDLWSLWVDLWPVLLLATAASGAVSVVWMILASANHSLRKWMPVSVAAVLLSAFAFLTVFANFPTA